MNKDVTNPPGSKKSRAATTKDVKNREIYGMWLLTFISLAAIGIAIMVFYQLDTLRLSVATIPPNLKQDQARLTDLERALSGLQHENRQLQSRAVSLRQQQTELSAKLDFFRRQLGMGNNDWALAEVENLLIIATHHLQLEHNTLVALAAMQAADDRLRALDDPGLLAVRRQVRADMNALKAVKAVDISGLVLFLADIVGRVNDLPLRPLKIRGDVQQNTPAEKPEGKWEQLKSSIWRELKGLVQISRQGEESIATLMPEQRYFLYQNLRLQLESARYAVLRRDTENLHVSVEIISSWLNDYFDTGDAGVVNILESLSHMESLELNPPLPAISSSLETLRAYRKEKAEAAEISRQRSRDTEE